MVLWRQLHHKNLLPFHGAVVTNRFGMVTPWLENGNIIGFTRKNPEVNRLSLVRRISGLHSGVFTGIS